MTAACGTSWAVPGAGENLVIDDIDSGICISSQGRVATVPSPRFP